MLLRAFGYPCATVTAALFTIVVTGSPSWSGVGISLGLVVLAASMLAEDAPQRRARIGAALGLAILLVTLAVRLGTGRSGRDLRMYTARDSGARLLNRLVDERDVATNAARALGFLHDISVLHRYVPFAADADTPLLADAMKRGYDALVADEGEVPSPVLATFAGLERAGDEDILEIGDAATAQTTVIFLHGYGGAFTLPCWQVSRAATRAGMATLCPSMGSQADWWSKDGELAVRAVVDSLRARGASRFILAGLSNGGAGATRLAPRMPGTFSAVIAISGADAHAATPNVPVLVLHGEHDGISPPAAGRSYAARTNGRYVSLNAGHFALVVRNDEALDAMAAFLIRNSGVRATP